MSYRRAITLAAASLLMVSLTSSILLLWRIDALRSDATLEEVLYIPSPKILKQMSLGYDGLLADVYWTRAVQYFGGKHYSRSTRYDLLAPLLDITTTLDPHLIVAYEFGSIFLAQKPPEGAGEPDKAIALVERGIRENPDDWRLFYDLGFLQYTEKQDYLAAARAFERGSHVPGAHPSMKILAAAMAQHAGDAATARLIWTTTLETATDKLIRANAIKHLRALKVDSDIQQLDQLIAAYEKSHGHAPASWMELIAAGMIRGIPVDPLGHSYKLKAGGRVEVETPDDLPFINYGLPEGEKPSFFGMPKTPPKSSD